MRYDVVVAGGEVLDPAAGLAGRMDVAISRGRVAAVEPSIAQDAAARVVDATGRFVVPGLIDLQRPEARRFDDHRDTPQSGPIPSDWRPPCTPGWPAGAIHNAGTTGSLRQPPSARRLPAPS